MYAGQTDGWERTPRHAGIDLGWSEKSMTRIVGAAADVIYNELYRAWALEHQTDPAEDPEFLREYRRRIGQDPETGLYVDPD